MTIEESGFHEPLRTTMTVRIRLNMKKSAETAVLSTSGRLGGYRSMNSLVEAAIQRELDDLATRFNHGDPFPPNDGRFRKGRPADTNTLEGDER
ncbi:hypothetical protein GCM10027406_07450 [Leifsonia lichenia]